MKMFILFLIVSIPVKVMAAECIDFSGTYSAQPTPQSEIPENYVNIYKFHPETVTITQNECKSATFMTYYNDYGFSKTVTFYSTPVLSTNDDKDGSRSDYGVRLMMKDRLISTYVMVIRGSRTTTNNYEYTLDSNGDLRLTAESIPTAFFNIPTHWKRVK